MTRAVSRVVVVCALALALATVAAAQPDPDPWGGGGGGSAPASGGSGSGSAGSAGSGSAHTKRTLQLPADVNAPEVTASASPTVVRLGGKFTVFIIARFQPGTEVNLREPIDLGPAFEIRRKLSEDSDVGDGRRQREWQLEVMAWELGELGIAPIKIKYVTNGKDGEVQTNIIRLRVEGVLGELQDKAEMRPNHAPVGLESTDWFWLWVIGGAIAAGVATTMYLYLSRRRKKQTVRLVGGVVAAPLRRLDLTSERALERLLAIGKSGVLDRDDDRRRGYQEMTEVIREYVGSRYRVATLDLTSSELLRKLESVALADERALIATWLERCDIVKYGGLRVTGDEARTTLDDARALVVTTTQLAAAAAATSKVKPRPPSKQEAA